MQAQTQSTFCGKLPVEIRSQIQVDYLFSYLHIAAIQANQLSGTHLQPPDLLGMTSRFSVPPSPLSRTCRRMYEEMRHGTGLAVLCVAPALRGTNLRVGLATEGQLRWDRLRRLVFINELDYPIKFTSPPPFLAQILEMAPHLTALDLEFSPTMSFARTDFAADALTKIADHPAIRTIRIRGNVPRTWLQEFAAMPGKEVVVEPLSWQERNPEEKQQVDQQRVEALEKYTALVHAFYERREKAAVTEGLEKKQNKSASASAKCLSCIMI